MAAEWAAILNHGSPSTRHWELVAAAIDNADRMLAHESGPAAARGGRRWCELASDTYQFASVHDASRRDADAGRCLGDPTAMRTWLAAPMPGTAATVADRLRIATQFDDPTRVDAEAVARLLAAAQDAGVFGIPHRRIQTRADNAGGLVLVDHPIRSHIIDDDHAPGMPHREHLELGLGTPRTRLSVHELVPEHANGVDAAISLLTRTGEAINAALHALDAQAPPQRRVSHRPAAATGRSFSPPRLDPGLGPPPGRPWPDPTSPQPGRSR